MSNIIITNLFSHNTFNEEKEIYRYGLILLCVCDRPVGVDPMYYCYTKPWR